MKKHFGSLSRIMGNRALCGAIFLLGVSGILSAHPRQAQEQTHPQLVASHAGANAEIGEGITLSSARRSELNNSDFEPVALTPSPHATDCSECAERVQPLVEQCKQGQMSACYRAAQYLCQCNLDAGGCGSSREALQQCVDENKKLADQMER